MKKEREECWVRSREKEGVWREGGGEDGRKVVGGMEGRWNGGGEMGGRR